MSRDRIFEAAKAVVAEEGLAGLTVRKVAQRAGLSAMALYRHFADKDALMDALMADGFTAWEHVVRSIQADDPIEWLKASGEAFLDFALSQPHRFDAAFLFPAPRARQYPDDFAAGRSPSVAMIAARIDQAKAQGRIGDTPTLQIALGMAALAQGFVSMQRANRFSSEDEFKALFRAALRHGLASYQPGPSGGPP